MSRRDRRGATSGAHYDDGRSNGGRGNNRRRLGQNFLKDGWVARRIVAGSGLGAEDLVVEIGAGGGMLTRELACTAGRVLAVEYDPYWAARLEERFSDHENVRVVQGDALEIKLPEQPFVVVANLPFGATTSILHTLLDDPGSPLRSAHLIVQRQVALKHARPNPTTLKTLNWSPWYEFSAGLGLSADAFHPRPRVDARLMVAAKRGPPLVDPRHRHAFRALVRRAFAGAAVGRTLRPPFTRTQLRRLATDNGFDLGSPPSTLTVHQWAGVFRFMARAIPRNRWPGAGDIGR